MWNPAPCAAFRRITPNRDLEWVPGRAIRQLQISDIDAKTRAETRADRDKQLVPVMQNIETNAGDDVSRAGHAAVTVIENVHTIKIVDQDHHACTLATKIPADRWPLPENTVIANVLRVKRAFAVGQAS